MTDYDWKPGDIAMVKSATEKNDGRCIWVEDCAILTHPRSGHWHSHLGGYRSPHPSARPLVVLDPESDADVVRYRNVSLGYSPSHTTTLSEPWLAKYRKRVERLLPEPKPTVCTEVITINGTPYPCADEEGVPRKAGHSGKHTIHAVKVEWST